MFIRFARNLAQRFNFKWRNVLLITGIGLLVYSMLLYIIEVFTYLVRYAFATSPTFINMIADIHYNGFNWPVLNITHLILVVMILILLYKHHTALRVDSRNFKYSKSGIYGTAQYLQQDEAKDVAEIATAEDANGIILGKLDRKTTRNLVTYKPDASGNHNVMVFGASGTGKTVCIVIPSILQYIKAHESCIITDPKGELYQKTSMWFRKNGYKVLKFDMLNMSTSDSWNVLSTATGDMSAIQERVNDIVSIIEKNSPIEKSVFDAPATMLLKAAILRVVLGKDYTDERKTMASVYEILTDQSSDIDSRFDVMTHPEAATACTLFKSVKVASANAFGNTLSTVISALQVFATPSVQAITSYNNIKLTEIGDQPTALFIIPNQTYTFLASLLFTFSFKDLMKHADLNVRPGIPENCLNVSTHFILDEFAQLGYIPEFSENLSQIRSRGISCMIILQSLKQLEPTYGLLSEAIVTNCSVWVLIGSNDKSTSQFISERAGTTTVAVKTVQHRAWETLLTFVHKSSTGDGKRDLYTLDEVYRFPKDQALIIFQQKNVFPVYKFAYFDHPVSLAGEMIWPTEEYAIPPLMVTDKNHNSVYNKSGRDQYYEKMERDIQTYQQNKQREEERQKVKPSTVTGFINNIIGAYEDARTDTRLDTRKKKRTKRRKSIRSPQMKEHIDYVRSESESEEPVILTVVEDIPSETYVNESFRDTSATESTECIDDSTIKCNPVDTNIQRKPVMPVADITEVQQKEQVAEEKKQTKILPGYLTDFQNDPKPEAPAMDKILKDEKKPWEKAEGQILSPDIAITNEIALSENKSVKITEINKRVPGKNQRMKHNREHVADTKTATVEEGTKTPSSKKNSQNKIRELKGAMNDPF